MSPSAAIVAIGTELTTGRIRDTHGEHLSRLCTSLGIDVNAILLLPDKQTIETDIRRLIGTCDLVIITGGLGPTSDDLTRELIGRVAGKPLVFHHELWDTILDRFRGRTPAESNRKQAEIPEDFSAIENKWGTAPGFYGRIGDALVVVLPGPPRELVPMCEASVRGLLETTFGVAPTDKTVLTTFLIAESTIEDIATQIADESTGDAVTWSTRAELQRIVVTLSGRAEECSAFISALRASTGDLCLAEGETDACECLFDVLRARELTISTAESCTGGLLAKKLTDRPGSSDVFWGGFVTYDNEAKIRLLGVRSIVQHGAVSAEVATEMAEGALAAAGTDVSIAVSGIAGPGGGTPEKPVGTIHIAVARKQTATAAFALTLRGNRERIRERTAVAAFVLARGLIEEKDIDRDPFWHYI